MITFTSAFASRIEAMLEWREALGYSRRTLTYELLSFDRFCVRCRPGETVLSRELATAWCQEGTRVDWPAHKARAVRAFGKYLRLLGEDAFELPAAWIGPRVRSLPHVFADAELAAFFARFASTRYRCSSVSCSGAGCAPRRHGCCGAATLTQDRLS
jgi:integrase/recombinase XerD